MYETMLGIVRDKIITNGSVSPCNEKPYNSYTTQFLLHTAVHTSVAILPVPPPPSSP